MGDRSGRALSWEFVFSTYLPALVLALGTGIAVPALPILAKSFNVGFFMASLVITVFLIGGMIGSLPTGALIDRFGSRTVMIAGPLLTSGMGFLVMTAHSFPLLLVFRFIDGWAAQLWLMGRVTNISALSGSNERGRQINWMLGMDNVGKLSGPIAGGFVATAWGARSPFGVYAALALLALVPIFLLTKEAPRQPRPARAAGVRLTPGQALVRQKAYYQRILRPRMVYFGVAFCGAVSRGPVGGGLLHLYAAYAYNLDAKTIGIIATSGGCLLVPIGFWAGHLLDRIGRKRTIVPGYAGFTVAMFFIAVTAFIHLSLWWYILGFLGVVASQGLTVGSTQLIGADVAPPEGRGTFYGYFQAINQLGTSTSPIVFGLLADAIGYGSSFILLAVASFAAAVLLFGAVEPTRFGRATPVDDAPALGAELASLPQVQ